MINENTILECIGSEEVEILKSYAEEVFKSVASKSDKQYEVLLCRRSLVVFAIFCYVYNIPFTRNVLCSDDLSPLKSGDKALLIDDIIIHGRTVKRLYSVLKELGISVSISAFYKKYDAEFLDKDILNSYTYLYGRDVTETEWHDFSNRLIKLILRSGVPYTTFTYSFAYKSDTALKCLYNYKSITVEQTTMKEAGMSLTVFFDTEFKTNFKLLSQLCNYACIRKYTLDKDPTAVYIPFVFIPALNPNTFSFLGKSLAKLGFANSIIQIFVDSVHTLEYKARFLSFLLSYAYGIVSLNRVDEDIQRASIIKSIIKKSFLSSFDSVLELAEEQCTEILNLDIDFDENIPEVSKDSDFFTEYSFENSSLDERLITNAISALHTQNEKRVYEKKDSSWGYRFKDISKPMKDNYKLVGNLISMWDIGKASYCFKESDGWVYSCVTDGEQAYRIDHQNFAPYSRTVALIQSVLPFCEGDTFNTLFEKCIKDTQNCCDEIALQIEDLRRCSAFLKDRSVADLNVDGVDLTSNDKLYERAQIFLRGILKNGG